MSAGNRVVPDFTHTDEREPHHDRTKAILLQHPEVRTLIGKNPATFLIILGTVAAQIALAVVLRDASWWLIGLVAYSIGAFADHALFLMVNECAHNLVFKSTRLNMTAAIIANFPQFFPSAVSFKRYHLKHHSFQGVHELDADLPGYWEAKLINKYAIGKATWLLFFPLFQITRTPRTKAIPLLDRWVVWNWIVQAHYSWTRLLLRFLFDQELSLFSRIVRRNRGGVAVTKDA